MVAPKHHYWSTPRSFEQRQQKARDNVRLALELRKHYDVRTGQWEPPKVVSRKRTGAELPSPQPRSRPRFNDRPSSAGRRRGISLAREMFNEHSGRSGISPRQASRLWSRGTRTSEGDHIVDNNRDGIYFNGRFVPYSNSLKRKTSISRHKKARKARSMARSRYASKAKRSSRRGYKSRGMKKSYSRRPKGAYRGATIPKWMKGETKHILVHDGNQDGLSYTLAKNTSAGNSNASGGTHTASKKMNIGDIVAYSLNPMVQGNQRDQRNGRSVDGTYLRIQGHIHNKATLSPVDSATTAGQTSVAASSTGIQQRAYVRMLILSCKGGNVPSSTAGVATGEATTTVGSAPFVPELLYKKIDGSIHGFDSTVSALDAAKRVRSLQLPVNKALYTVLSDQTFQLSAATEGFGSSDILFDKKIKLKQRTTWHDAANSDSFQKNQLVAVFMTVDPHMFAPNSGSVVADQLNEKIEVEFESKYSYKDF